MCTKLEGRKIAEVYDKYRTESLVEPEDLKALDALADSGRIRYSYRKDGIFAKSVVM